MRRLWCVLGGVIVITAGMPCRAGAQDVSWGLKGGVVFASLRAVIGTSNLRERGEGAFRSRALQVLLGYRF